MSNIVVVGASGHAKVVIDILEREGKHRIVGLVGRDEAPASECYGYRILGREEDLPDLVRSHPIDAGIVAIGENWVRSKVAKRIQELVPGFCFVTAVHPRAQLARGVVVGRGSVIMAGVVVNSDTRIGEFCILNTRASLDHDCVLEDYASLAPGATVGGDAKIGRFSAVCLGAAVVHGINIGEHAVIGAGATVISDIPGFVVAYGTPARVIRQRQAGDRYL